MSHRMAMIQKANRERPLTHTPMLAIAGDSAVGKTTLAATSA